MGVFFKQTCEPMIQPTSLSDPREGWVGSWLLALASEICLCRSSFSSSSSSPLSLLKSHRSGLETHGEDSDIGGAGCSAEWICWCVCLFFKMVEVLFFSFYVYVSFTFRLLLIPETKESEVTFVASQGKARQGKSSGADE